MTVTSEKEKQLARQGRLVALVIAGTLVLWIASLFIGRAIGLDPRFAFLFDMAALAALFWALVVGLQIWRKRR